VDWVLARLGTEVDQLRARIAELEDDKVPIPAGSASDEPAPAADE
jgi:BMFP domain-containing protein YqiC